MLEKIISKVKDNMTGVNDYFNVPGRVEHMRDYGIRNYLSNSEKEKLLHGKTQEEKEKLYQNIEYKIKNSIDDYKEQLNSLTLKAGKATGAGSILYDAYNIWNAIPGEIFAPMKYVIVGTKTLLETPSMLKYFSKSHDWYGAIDYAGSKALHAFVPMVGSMFDRNIAQRVIKKGAIKNAVNEVLIQEGVKEEYKPLFDRIMDRVNYVTSPKKINT